VAADTWPGAGDRLSLVVLARPRSADFATFVGARWEVDRSREGVAAEGGVGAGLYEDGAAEGE